MATTGPMSYILDAVRTPRGRGKAGKGALSQIHPQELLAQVLTALPARGALDPKDVDDVIVGCVSQVERARREHRAQRRARRRLAERGLGRHAQPLLRLGPAGGELRRDGRGGGRSTTSSSPAASRACRACRWAPTAAGIDGNNLHLRERVFQVPQGISADLIATLEGFTREDVDAVRACARSGTRRARIKEGRFAKSLVAVRDPKTGEVAARARRVPAARHDARGARQARAGVRRRWARAGRAERRDARSARARALPRGQGDPATSTPPATRAASSTAPPRWCSRPSAT